MDHRDRERAVSQAFVEMADTLVGDFDVAELMSRLVEHSIQLLGTDAAGLLLKDPRGGLQLMASTSEATKFLELFQLQIDEGPCVDAVSTARAVTVSDMADDPDRWPQFGPAAQRSGFLAVHAVPLRLRDTVIGALNLFNHSPGALSRADLDLAQALADIACIGLLQARAIANAEVVVEQLEGALTSRVIIEQAKGLLAGRRQLSMDAAFDALRSYARRSHTQLTNVAGDLIGGRLSLDDVVSAER